MTAIPRPLRQALLIALLMLGSLSLYLAILWWRGPDAQIVTKSAWDEAIPFQPLWVWVYLIPYLLGPLAAMCFTPATFAWYLRRALAMVFLTLLIFILLPTKTVPHPTTSAADGDALTMSLYASMAEADGPAANAAPSLHVSLTCLLFWALVRDWPRGWPLWLIGVLLVWASTLFTWQHHLIDVATGAVLGCLFALPRRPTATPPKP